MSVFFTAPGCPGQKGMIEHIIGVLRRFFGKNTDLSKLTPRMIRRVEDWFNNRPMKSLGYKTPNQVYYNIA